MSGPGAPASAPVLAEPDRRSDVPKRTAVDRFMEKFTVDTDTQCWVWTAGMHKLGYGLFWNGKTVKAHRFSLLEAVTC